MTRVFHVASVNGACAPDPIAERVVGGKVDTCGIDRSMCCLQQDAVLALQVHSNAMVITRRCIQIDNVTVRMFLQLELWIGMNTDAKLARSRY